MERVINFSAGPSILPLAVLHKAQAELLNYKGSGQSVMEMSHRSPVFEGILAQTEKDLRTLLDIPETYTVLFLQGGASLQFSMIPMNLLRDTKKVDFIHTGEWSKKAMTEVKRFGSVTVVASSEATHFNCIPSFCAADFSEDAEYIHYVSNNTIFGTRITDFPDLPSEKIVVCDMSSDILSRPVEISRYGLIFAGAQKNMGIAGLTVVIIRNDLLGRVSGLPPMLDYKAQADNGSMLNTPPCFSIYMAGLVFDWLIAQGGLSVIEAKNEVKAKLLYDYLDASPFYRPTVPKAIDRSIMNVCFVTPTPELDSALVKFAESRGLVNLKGHRAVGGMRASLYNGMTIENVQTLIRVLDEFVQRQR
jgi:phosphoserine aminotransferase